MRLLVSFITLFLVLTASAHQYQKPYGDLKEDQKFRDYEVRIYRNEEPPPENDHNPDHQDGLGCFEILRSGKQIYFQRGIIFRVNNVATGTNWEEWQKGPKIMGQCITADKQPNLVTSEINGGNNAYADYYIFQIGKVFKRIASIKDAGDGAFEDLRKNGELELVSFDLTFKYWNCGGADSPEPIVIYWYRAGKYRLDLAMMKKPAPTEQELEKMAAGFRAGFGSVYILYKAAPLPGDDPRYAEDKWLAPVEMWGEMLDLIYSGNMRSAWRLCDLSCPVNHPGKSEFLREFKAQMRTSPYYRDISGAGFQN